MCFNLNECTTKIPPKQKNLTKNLKIGLKLQKNLDTKKFDLVKNLTYCSG